MTKTNQTMPNDDRGNVVTGQYPLENKAGSQSNPRVKTAEEATADRYATMDVAGNQNALSGRQVAFKSAEELAVVENIREAAGVLEQANRTAVTMINKANPIGDAWIYNPDHTDEACRLRRSSEVMDEARQKADDRLAEAQKHADALLAEIKNWESGDTATTAEVENKKTEADAANILETAKRKSVIVIEVAKRHADVRATAAQEEETKVANARAAVANRSPGVFVARANALRVKPPTVVAAQENALGTYPTIEPPTSNTYPGQGNAIQTGAAGNQLDAAGNRFAGVNENSLPGNTVRGVNQPTDSDRDVNPEYSTGPGTSSAFNPALGQDDNPGASPNANSSSNRDVNRDANRAINPSINRGSNPVRKA